MSETQINKSLWYLVRKDRQGKPWTFYVLLLTFKTATQADTWADLYGYANYFPMKGKDILERQKDESAGLAKLVYKCQPEVNASRSKPGAGRVKTKARSAPEPTASHRTPEL